MTVAEETNSTHIFTAMPSPDKQGQLSVKKIMQREEVETKT